MCVVLFFCDKHLKRKQRCNYCFIINQVWWCCLLLVITPKSKCKQSKSKQTLCLDTRGVIDSISGLVRYEISLKILIIGYLVVSIRQFLVFLMSFWYNGVCFIRFIYWLTMTSHTESFNWSKYTPLYEKEQNEREI